MTPSSLPFDFGIPVLRHIHPDAALVGQKLDAWATAVGLAASPREQARMRAAGFHLIAARILHDAPFEAVELFAQWVAFLFHLDDQQDEGPMGQSADTVHAVYNTLTSIIDGRPTAPSTAPAATALTDLWPRTATGLSPAWRERIRGHLLSHRDAFLTQIHHRDHGTVPTPDDYPALRRDANGMFMFDLVEAVLHTEVPARLAGGPIWQEMCEASNDITAWCNDLLSLAREAAAGESTNYVIVLTHATGCDTTAAVDQVRKHIQTRYRRLTDLRSRLTPHLDALPSTRQATTAYTADAICAMPGTQLAWLAESGRYLALPHPPARHTHPGPADGSELTKLRQCHT
ncbi:terpene synthase family protein [Streptomyces sp. NPDC058128]|uniref:terpene synthase family protein n=1 Tax=Streptomyces sp. NPDC058128 TaxID=3346352 RepID=UPI0036E05871